jgi:hypothetical protein
MCGMLVGKNEGKRLFMRQINMKDNRNMQDEGVERMNQIQNRDQ